MNYAVYTIVLWKHPQTFINNDADTELCLTLQPHELLPTRLICLWNFPGRNTGMGFHFLLEEESFRPRDWTHVTCVAGSFFTCWAILENSLVIQLLGLQASTAWGQVQSLVGDRRSWKPHGMAKKRKKKNNKKKKACLCWMQNFKNYAHQHLNFNFHMSQNIIFLLIF